MTGGSAPRFWWGEPGWQATLLSPAAAIYGHVSARRLRAGASSRADVPVLCVGNFTAGGAGKTPTALALARAARKAGRVPGFLSRGHGGSAREPLLVDTRPHGADMTGDEPLLLAARAPTVVARDRAAGARLLVEESGCDVVIMDDGFQSARLAVDLALLVVDGQRGLGNARVLPSGPLRAPLDVQLAHAGAVLIIGEGAAGDVAARAARAACLPVHRAVLRATNAASRPERGLLAFAGIADPAKFYRTLAQIGADVTCTRDFPDHHPFGPDELRALETTADRDGLALATTAKDAVRLAASEEGRRLLARIFVLEVELELLDGAADQLVSRTLRAFEARV